MGPWFQEIFYLSGWIIYGLGLFSALNAHSGYHFPLFPSNEAHDFHHLKFNNCYGFLGLLDYLHGTDTLFRSTKNYQRHYTYLSNKSIKELIPNENE